VKVNDPRGEEVGERAESKERESDCAEEAARLRERNDQDQEIQGGGDGPKARPGAQTCQQDQRDESRKCTASPKNPARETAPHAVDLGRCARGTPASLGADQS
jgi:hypothetical protein